MSIVRDKNDAFHTAHLRVQFLLDASAWILAIFVAVILRYEFDISRVTFATTALVGVTAVVLHFAAGRYFELYRGRFRNGNFEEVRALFGAALTVAIVVSVVVLLFGTVIQVQ